MYGPVVTLAALARLGIEEVDHNNNIPPPQQQHHGVPMRPTLLRKLLPKLHTDRSSYI